MWLVVALLGCQEYKLVEPPKVPPAQPPELPDKGYGGPPNWADCTSGWLGRFSNLEATHPDMEPAEDAEVVTDADAVRDDYQQRLADLVETWRSRLEGVGGRLVQCDTSQDPAGAVRALLQAIAEARS